MLNNMNEMLEKNDVMVRIGSSWYRLDEIGKLSYDTFPIFVSDDDGETFEYDMADVDEIDPIFQILQDVNNQGIMGVA